MNSRRLRLAVLGLALIGWLSTGVTTVASGEHGVVLRFGRAARVLTPGFHLTLPWPFEGLRRVDVEVSRRMPIGYRLADAERGLDPKPADVEWLTGDTNIIELRANILYRVDDPVAWLFGVSDAEGEDGHRSFTLRRIGEAVFTDLIAGTPVQEVLARGRGVFQVASRDRIQRGAQQLGLGVRITSVEILETTPPLMVIASFNRVSDAHQEADRMVLEAQGERRVGEQQAAAEATRRISAAHEFAAETLGAAQGFVQELDALGGALGGPLEGKRGKGLSAAARRDLWFERVTQVLGRLKRPIVLPVSSDGRPSQFIHRR